MNNLTDQPAPPSWQAPPPPPPAKRPFWKKKRFFIPAGLLILLIAVMPKGSDTADKIKAASEDEPASSKVVGSETQAGSVVTTATSTPKETEVPRLDIQLAEHGFTQLPPNSIGSSYGLYAAVVKNPNPTTWIAEDINVNITFFDAAGSVVDSENATIPVLAPGQTAAIGDSGSMAGVAKMEVKALVDSWDKAEGTFGSFTAEGAKIVSDTFGMKATGTLVSTYAKDLKEVRAVAVFRNAKGAIVGGGFTYVDFVPANGKIGFSINSLQKVPTATKVDIYAQPSNLTLWAD